MVSMEIVESGVDGNGKSKDGKSTMAVAMEGESSEGAAATSSSK